MAKDCMEFRATDIRWNPKERVIKQLIVKPGYPPMYLLDKVDGSTYTIPNTKNQFQVIRIRNDEQLPDKSVTRNKIVDGPESTSKKKEPKPKVPKKTEKELIKEKEAKGNRWNAPFKDTKRVLKPNSRYVDGQ